MVEFMIIHLLNIICLPSNGNQQSVPGAVSGSLPSLVTEKLENTPIYNFA